MRRITIIALITIVLLIVFSGHISERSTQTTHRAWSKIDSLAYAHDKIEIAAQAQFTCLSNLWGKESAWDPSAYNPVKVMGKKAGGIPQLLGMSPLVPPTQQIDRGLSYIYFRYVTPCEAWKHWQRKGWY